MFMSTANLNILMLVIAVVVIVLGLSAAGMYWLNKAVDQSDA